ncbi:hypothetical protein BDW67DRAFT_86450 [Aspergillus spinulosporus]
MKSRDLKRACYYRFEGLYPAPCGDPYVRRGQSSQLETHSRRLQIQQYLGHSSSGPIVAHAQSAVAKSTHSTSFPSLSWPRCGSDQHLGWSLGLYSNPALALFPGGLSHTKWLSYTSALSFNRSLGVARGQLQSPRRTRISPGLFFDSLPRSSLVECRHSS